MKKIYSLLLLAGLFLFGAQNVMANYYVTHNANLPTGGNAWTLQQTQDLMTEDNGVYFLIVSNVGTGEVQFKITTDDTWNGANGDQLDNDLSDAIPGLAGTYDGGNKNIGFQLNEPNDIIIYYNPSESKVYVKYYVTASPVVHLSASPANVLPGETITLTADAENFSGAVNYAYSYSTDGGSNYTAMAGNTMVAGASGTIYKFKVVATYNAEEAEATSTNIYVVVCTVTGAFGDKSANADDEVFGKAWKPDQVANDMTYNAGVFSLEKSAVYLPAGNIYFKVALNHTWDVSYPSENYDLEISQAGYYDLTFSFTWADREEDGSGVSAEATFLYPHLIRIAGDFNEWHAAQMTTSMNKLTCSSTIALTAGDTVEFKILSATGAAEAWLGNNGKMVRNNCSGWAMEEEKNNCRIFADETGDYTFTWVYGTGVLSITYPNTYTRNFDEVKYGTICLPAAAELENAKVYTVTDVSNSQITIVEKANTNVEAGHPYIIKPLVAGNVVATFDGTLPVSDAVNDYLYGNIGTEPIVLQASDNAYILTAGEFRPVIDGGEGVTVGLYRAYLKMENAQGAPALRIVEVANDATNIQNIEGYEVAVKFIENGQLYILKDGVVYTAAGVAVK